MVVSPFLVAAEVRGMTNFLLDLARDPSYAADLLETITAGIAAYATAMADLGVCDAIMFENAGATRDLIGPHHVERFVNPYHRQVLAAVGATSPDVALIEHNCSERPYLDDALASNVDAVSLAQPVTAELFDTHQWATVGPAATKRCFIGGLDHARLVLDGPASAIHDRTIELLAELQGRPSVVSTGCEIPLKTPVAHVRAIADAIAAHAVSRTVA
jgi:uroporphyrinogen-III decarboxylase